MAKPLTDDERDRIVRLLGEGHSYANIAKQVGRSHGTIGRVAQSIGHQSGQTNLARAHEARSAFCAERRALAAARAQERLDEILEDFWGKRPVVLRDAEGGSYPASLAPDWKGVADMAKAAQTLARLVLDVDRHDNRQEEGMAAVDAWLRDVVGSSA